MISSLLKFCIIGKDVFPKPEEKLTQSVTLRIIIRNLENYSTHKLSKHNRNLCRYVCLCSRAHTYVWSQEENLFISIGLKLWFLNQKAVKYFYIHVNVRVEWIIECFLVILCIPEKVSIVSFFTKDPFCRVSGFKIVI